ncbi:uncharacterized membrane protein YttA-like isoform X2 [Dysidea avara]|uniref:uncharacterized membrane protein YttA-like isoform X2 n=1 Tax=Dysidea avara TaxID=196820 RepID=UPI00332109F3
MEKNFILLIFQPEKKISSSKQQKEHVNFFEEYERLRDDKLGLTEQLVSSDEAQNELKKELKAVKEQAEILRRERDELRSEKDRLEQQLKETNVGRRLERHSSTPVTLGLRFPVLPPIQRRAHMNPLDEVDKELLKQQQDPYPSVFICSKCKHSLL